MAALDYGYEITIAQNAVFDPNGVATNQWQRQVPGNANWEDIAGAAGETYVVSSSDRSGKIRLQQSLNGSSAISNELTVTSDAFTPIAEDVGERLPYGKWWGSAVASNGNIYSAPYMSSHSTTGNQRPDCRVLEINGSTGAWRLCPTNIKGNQYDFDYRGMVRGADDQLYLIPHASRSIAKYDPDTDTATLLKSVPESPFVANWYERMFSGGVLAPNGKIYLVPSQRDTVGVYDPATNDFYLIGGDYGLQLEKWMGGALAPNGKIYCAPHNADKVLVIDPTTDTVKEVSSGLSGNSKYSGAVLAPNGKIYCTPFSAGPVLEIDPRYDSCTQFSSIFGSTKYGAGVLAGDGNIYCPAWDKRGEVLKIDPKNRSTTSVSYNGGNTEKSFVCSALAPSGAIFFQSYQEYYTGKFDLGTPATNPDWDFPLPGLPGDVLNPLSPYFNKF